MKARADREEEVERLHHQARASEKNERKGKFGHNEKGSKAVVRSSGSRGSTALFELRVNVGFGGARGGRKAEDESGERDESGGEKEDGGIQSYRRAHQHIRGEHLAHNAATHGPEGDAEGDFAGTTCAANEEKIRDVGAGN